MLETIFYHVDNFCKEYEKLEQKILLNGGKKTSPNKGRIDLVQNNLSTPSLLSSNFISNTIT